MKISGFRAAFAELCFLVCLIQCGCHSEYRLNAPGNGRSVAVYATSTTPVAQGDVSILCHGTIMYVGRNILFDDNDIVVANKITTNQGRPAIVLTLNDAGQRRMLERKGDYLDKPVAIYLNGELISTPVVQSPLGSTFMIWRQDGELSEAEMKAMLDRWPAPGP